MGQQTLPDRSKNHRSAGAQRLHLLDRLERFARVAHGRQPAPFQPLRAERALTRHIAIVAAKQCGLETGLGSHAHVQRGREKHWGIKDWIATNHVFLFLMTAQSSSLIDSTKKTAVL